MSRLRLAVFILCAALAATIFVRLGIWQLHRLDERRARNALVRMRMDSTEVDVRATPADTARAHYRRVRVAGGPDYAHELVLTARTRNGSPGVDLLTPIRLAGTDTAVLVNRGWVYSPDAATVDLAKWHETDTSFTGYLEEFAGATGGTTERPGVLTRLSAQAVQSALPYPVFPMYVVAVGDSAIAADRPARVGMPALDEGPHMSYAIQWFGFAVVAIGGAAAVVVRSRATARGAEDTQDRRPS